MPFRTSERYAYYNVYISNRVMVNKKINSRQQYMRRLLKIVYYSFQISILHYHVGKGRQPARSIPFFVRRVGTAAIGSSGQGCLG